ncbi:MAG: HEAT repeat domain-containing protein [Planctomycetes bacterium]|nr:HEAT repeat domain-containing protein [Planctomycetota bacterium]
MPRTSLRPAVLSLAAALAVVAAAHALQGGWKEDFDRDINSPDSTVRYQAVRRVDGNDPKGLEVLLKVLANTDPRVMDWYVRRGAIEALQNAYEGGALEEIVAAVTKDKNPLVREGCVAALGAKRTRVDVLAEALEDKADLVRRAAARALMGMKDLPEIKAAIGPLIQRMGREDPYKDFREFVAVKTALEAITGEFLGPDPEAWKSWWTYAEETWAPGAAPDPERAKKAEEEGNKAEDHKEATSTGLELEFSTRGKGDIPLLVIHDTRYHDHYFQPYLQSIEDTCKVFYIKMPEAKQFEGKAKALSEAVIEIPVDLLCDAFEELRARFDLSRFAILTHYDSCLIAFRYATRHPEKVSHVILVGGVSGQGAYGNIVGNIEREGQKRKDLEMEHMAQSLQITDMATGKTQYEVTGEAEFNALQRKFWSTRFANPFDTHLYDLYQQCERPHEGKTTIFPDFDVMREKKVPVPMLICSGKQSLWSSEKDLLRIKAHYGERANLVVFPRSAEMPFIEETADWAELVKKFFKKFPYRTGKK